MCDSYARISILPQHVASVVRRDCARYLYLSILFFSFFLNLAWHKTDKWTNRDGQTRRRNLIERSCLWLSITIWLLVALLDLMEGQHNELSARLIDIFCSLAVRCWPVVMTLELSNSRRVGVAAYIRMFV